MRHFNVTFKPEGKGISIHAGATLTEAAGQAGIILNTSCGGKGTCGKCIVKLEPDGREVLACQYKIQTDVVVNIPATSRFFEQKILEHGIDIPAEILPKIYLREDVDKVFGLAVDIGTTTVVAKLIDMSNGQCLGTQATINPQIQYGDDCVSRIAYAQSDAKLAQLHQTIISCVNELISKLCSQLAIDSKQVCAACVVGNTTMNHIFLKLPVISLGQAPYEAYSVDAHSLRAEQLSLQINPAAQILTVENIAGFVGSDITAVALAADINSANEITLIVDIGTNGEIVLGTAGKLYAASCAAGPAFEGARISCGGRAAEGAIEAVVGNENNIDVDVIGGGPARTICGSGLIDAVALLLNLGVIDSSGRFVECEKLKANLPSAILSRVIEHNGQPAFCLSDAQQQSPRVILTQKDVRETQLAKAAIRAGIKLLQKKLGIGDSDIKHVLLAGAFGNYIRRESALRIGLLPQIEPERIVFVGNAASSGAQMMLLSTQSRESACRLARKIEYVEIANEPEFQEVFADCMIF